MAIYACTYGHAYTVYVRVSTDTQTQLRSGRKGTGQMVSVNRATGPESGDAKQHRLHTVIKVSKDLSVRFVRVSLGHLPPCCSLSVEVQGLNFSERPLHVFCLCSQSLLIVCHSIGS